MAKWKIDPAHASVEFKVQHLGLAWTRGQIFNVSGEITFDPENAEESKFNGEIDITSITTGQEMRDGHLKSPDFFDVAQYPKAHFNSKKVKSASDNKFTVEGDLTIKDVTKSVEIDVEFLGTTTKFNQDGTSEEVAAFTGKTKINRQDFGLKWNVDLPNGKVLVGNEVQLIIEVEAIKQ